MNRGLLFVLALVVGLECEARSQTQPYIVVPMTQKDLDAYFASVHIEDCKFTFVRKAQGGDLTCVEGDNHKISLAPGSTFRASFGDSFRFFRPGEEIKFIPLRTDRGLGGFLMEELLVGEKVGDQQTIHAGSMQIRYDNGPHPAWPKVQVIAIKDLDELMRWEFECARPPTQTVTNL